MSQHSEQFDAYIAKQNGIYDNFRNAHALIGVTNGIEPDAGGTAPQAAFLVAWRHPEQTTSQIEEVSLTVNGIVKSLTYGRHNAHTTLSDFGLEKGLVISPVPGSDHAETLDTLTESVRDGLNAAGTQTIADRAVRFEDTLTNGKTVVTTGQANHEIWSINEAVKAAATERGLPLKGAWGSHTTLDRFLEARTAAESAPLTTYLGRVAHFGLSVPTSIDVGYFQTDPEAGFQSTTVERFELGTS